MKGGRGRLQRFGLTDTSLEDLKNRTSKTLSKNQEINAAAGRLDKSSCECECPRERQQGLRSIDLSDCRAWAGAGAGESGFGGRGRKVGLQDQPPPPTIKTTRIFFCKFLTALNS